MHFSVTTAATAALLVSGASANLHQFAVAAGKRYFGTATDNGELTNTAYTAILNNSRQFGQITPGNGQKWQFTEPNQGQFDYTSGDQIVALAQGNNQILRCHTLVWYSQLPSWVSSGTWTKDQLTEVINTHIANEVGHYKGQCYAWDVVNEALEEDGTYRDSVFHKVLGTDYIPIAFKAAAAADSAAKLYYNDYNIENMGAKQAAAVGIVKLVVNAGARIDGVGMQAHFTVGSTPSQSELESAMNAYVSAGATEVAYTELDIRFDSLPASDSGLQQQATDYASVTKACLATKECVGITIWDFTDKYSWIPSTFPGNGAACLYDENLKPKPAYYTVAAILARAAGSGVVASSTAAASSAATSSATTLATSVRASSTTQAAVSTVVAPSSTAAQASTTAASSVPTAIVAAAQRYQQCGGNNFSGPTACASGSTCQKFNDWYSQCL